MATIEELVKEIQDGTLVEDSEFWPPHPDLAVAKAAIIAGWNEALAAMKSAVNTDIKNYDDGAFHCWRCGGNSIHIPGCPVAALQAAIAKMEEDAEN